MGCIQKPRTSVPDPEATHYVYWLSNERTASERCLLVDEVAAQLVRDGDQVLGDEVLADKHRAWQIIDVAARPNPRSRTIAEHTQSVRGWWYADTDFPVDQRYDSEMYFGMYKQILLQPWQTVKQAKDKRSFGTWCAQYGVPSPRTHELSADGSWLPPLNDLFLKPNAGHGGHGTLCYTFSAEEATYTEHRTNGLSIYTRDELGLRIHQLNCGLIGADSDKPTRGNCYESGGRYIVQDRLTASPCVTQLTAAADMSVASLSTVRLVTAIGDDSRPEVVCAVLRMASDPDAIVDSVWSGGLFCKIDLHTERLVGIARGWTGAVYRAHPLTGVVFDGYQLPGVNAAVASICNAHTMLNDEKSRYFFRTPCRWLSWDVALVPPSADRVEPFVVVEIDAVHSPFFQFVCGPWGAIPAVRDAFRCTDLLVAGYGGRIPEVTEVQRLHLRNS